MGKDTPNTQRLILTITTGPMLTSNKKKQLNQFFEFEKANQKCLFKHTRTQLTEGPIL